jgi:hypothetical protein
MKYGARLSYSVRSFFANPALLSVILLWFILNFLLAILFDLVKLALLPFVNPEYLQAALTGMDTTPFLTPATYAFNAVFFLVQGFVFVYVLSFFSAGLFGMFKNLMQDGSTIFREFFPEAKRNWYVMFRIQLARFAITFVVMMLAYYGLMQYLGTTAGFLTSAQWAIIIFCLLLSVIIFAAMSFLLLYAESDAVLSQSMAMQAMKTSAASARKHALYSLGVMLTAAVIVLIGGVVVLSLSSLVSKAFDDTGAVSMIISSLLNYLLLIVVFSAGIIANIFIVRSYYDLTKGHKARK